MEKNQLKYRAARVQPLFEKGENNVRGFKNKGIY